MCKVYRGGVMSLSLQELHLKSIKLYGLYLLGSLSQSEYLSQLKPLDEQIDEIEMKLLSSYLQGSPACEKSSLIQLR